MAQYQLQDKLQKHMFVSWHAKVTGYDDHVWLPNGAGVAAREHHADTEVHCGKAAATAQGRNSS
jgi:hypothetical protein